MLNIEWTPAKIERLAALRDDGKSASIIAQDFGVTRNAVLGIIKRLRDKNVEGFGGLNPIPRLTRRPAHARTLTRERPPRLPASPLGLPLFDFAARIPVSRRVSFLDLGKMECLVRRQRHEDVLWGTGQERVVLLQRTSRRRVSTQ